MENKLRIHITNINGTGASRLVACLLPAIEEDLKTLVTELYVPSSGIFANYVPKKNNTKVHRYKRNIPNGISRFLECTLFSYIFSKDTPILVLGDLPLRCKSKQVVLVHTSYLCISNLDLLLNFNIKYIFASLIFNLNKNHVDKFIVQTDEMKKKLMVKYKLPLDRIITLSQPIPTELNKNLIARKKRRNSNQKLKLFYPAANYPHKNHILLSGLSLDDTSQISQIILTIDLVNNPATHLPCVKCVGLLEYKKVITYYNQVDALLFLSEEESYGFPLIEAMFVGLPIICPDLPYARILCGNEAIYFNSNDKESLISAINTLNLKLHKGWWPDWSSQIVRFPTNWNQTASSFLEIIANKNKTG
ncbi:glycosyltransferase [Amylibacter sp.]|nr:glycosyltransferase [Amylibacter sp.]